MGDKCGVIAYEVSCWGKLLLTEAYRRAKTNVFIARELKSIRELKMGTPSSARIIKDVDLELKALEIVYSENGNVVEGLADSNVHRRKLVGEGKNISWGGAQTKDKGRKCEIAKNMFLHIDLLKLCLKKKHNITDFFPNTTVFYD